jgi:hypothetical protein
MDQGFRRHKRNWQLALMALALPLASCGQPAPQPPKPDDAKSAAPLGFKLPATGNLSLSDLTNFAKLERDFVKPDDFSKGFDDSPLRDRQFTITLPVSQYAGDSLTPAQWSYDPEKEELSLTVSSGDATSYAPALTVQNTTEFGPKKKMSNAFGAEVEVTTMETWDIKLGRDVESPLGVFPREADEYAVAHKYQPLSQSMKLDPQKARALIANLTLQLEGTVAANAQNQTVQCYDNHTAAKFDSPTEWTQHECIIQAHLTRVAYVTKDGKVLKEWRDSPAKAPINSERHPVSQDAGPMDNVDIEQPIFDENGSPINASENVGDY